MKASDILGIFKTMYDERWSYRLGAAAQGCVDCSGAFVYAYKQLGGKIEHGSNSIFHLRVGDVQKTPRPGYAAFKVRPWAPSEDGNHWYCEAPGDVYHIGLVAEDGRSVYNAKGEKYGFCRDGLKGWTLFAPLTGVDYDTEEKTMARSYRATVATKSGSLNLRAEPGKDGQIIGKLPKGARVQVTASSGSWCFVTYEGLSGYVSAEYLTDVETAEHDPDEYTPGILRQYIVTVYEDGGLGFAEYAGG